MVLILITKGPKSTNFQNNNAKFAPICIFVANSKKIAFSELIYSTAEENINKI